MSSIRFATASIIALALASCGIVTPRIQEAWDVDIPKGTLDPPLPVAYTASSRLEFEIMRRVYCDIKDGVNAADRYSVTRGDDFNHMTRVRSGIIPPGWIVSVSLSLAAEESSSLSPGVSLVSPLASLVTNAGSAHPVVNAQSSSVGIGATLSGTATKTQKAEPFWLLDNMKGAPKPQSWCFKSRETGRFVNDPFDFGTPKPESSPFVLESDLEIKEWIFGEMINWVLYDSDSKPMKHPDNKGSGNNTITQELSFVVVSSASITPSWKLARATANTAAPFFGTGRTRTHNLIITIGPQDERTARSFNAAQIGSEVRRGQ